MIFSYFIEKITIREQITPKGDGNAYSENEMLSYFLIREQITPKGDGNFYS